MQPSLCSVIIYPNLLLCNRDDFLPSVRVQVPVVTEQEEDLLCASVPKHEIHLAQFPSAETRCESTSAPGRGMDAERGSMNTAEILMQVSSGSFPALSQEFPRDLLVKSITRY